MISLNRAGLIFIAGVLLLVSACSSTPDKDAPYKSSSSTKPLEVPPDLTIPVSNLDYNIPGIASEQQTYLKYSGKGKQQPLLPKGHKDIRFVREGNLAWLEMKGKPEKVWSEVQQFLTRIGYELRRSERLLGLLETSWYVNKIAESGWFSDSIGEMDKFRVRLEPGNKKNTTLLFVRHMGMRGAIVEKGDSETTRWEPRPSDPELETELLRKFLIFRGLSDKQVQHLVVRQQQSQTSSIKSGSNENVVLEVNESFARTWRRVGLALDRMGLLIDDRNRTAGVYYIRIPEHLELEQEKNWFSSLLSLVQGQSSNEYLLSLKKQKSKTIVAIKYRGNAKLDDSVARKILARIQAHIS